MLVPAFFLFRLGIFELVLHLDRKADLCCSLQGENSRKYRVLPYHCILEIQHFLPKHSTAGDNSLSALRPSWSGKSLRIGGKICSHPRRVNSARQMREKMRLSRQNDPIQRRQSRSRQQEEDEMPGCGQWIGGTERRLTRRRRPRSGRRVGILVAALRCCCVGLGGAAELTCNTKIIG